MENVKNIIKDIKNNGANIESVYFVGCGASKADLYPAKFFLENNAKKIRASIITANEFNHKIPKGVNENAIVITCSLLGTTPETVEAAKIAKNLGAKVIIVTHKKDSNLGKQGDYAVINEWEGGYSKKFDKMLKVLALAVEILNTYEGYEHYNKIQAGFENIDGIIDRGASICINDAKHFAKEYKDSPVIYVMSSGATTDVAYSFSICLLLEMQWINSASFNTGEFFHGPFEIVEEGVPFMLLMNDGSTRALDQRALTFLERMGAKNTLIDAKDFGIGDKIDKEVLDYFNPMLIGAIVRVYAEQLAEIRKHPLTKRRYMWKLEY